MFRMSPADQVRNSAKDSEKLAFDFMRSEKFTQLIQQTTELLESNETLRATAAAMFNSSINIEESATEPSANLGLRNRKLPFANKKPSVFREEKSAPPKPLKNNPMVDTGFIKHMVNTTLPSVLAQISGLPTIAVAALLGGATTAAATKTFPTDLQIVGKGNEDLCEGLIFCIQAAVKNITSGNIVATMYETVSVTNNDGSSLTEKAFQNCLEDKNFFSNILHKILGAPADLVEGNVCSATSAQWQGTQAKGSADGLSAEACEQFKNQFSALTASCQTLKTAGHGLAIGLGITAGLIVLCCICCGIHSVIKKQSCKDSVSDCLSVLPK